MPTTAQQFDLEAMRRSLERDGSAAAAPFIADDVVWTEVDARTPPSAPAVLHGRDAVMASLREAQSRGIVSRVTDGLVSGDRGAIAIECTYPNGGRVLEHALLTLRDGQIARWDAVLAWDA